MRSLLTSLAISAAANALSFAAAAWLLDGFDIRFWWAVVSVVLFTALTVTLREIVVGTVDRFVRGYTILGGLVLTFVALWVTDLAVPRRGFSIDGTWTWIAVTAIVWAAGVAYGEVERRPPPMLRPWASRPERQVMSAITAPEPTVAPTSAERLLIVPALWALIGCSIFIASMTTTRSPSSTS